MKYQEHFEILEYLEQDPNIVSSPDLWQDDPEKVFSDIMERLAQQGLTSKDPTSGHSILASAFSWYINRLGYELNLKPAWEWYQFLRLLGLERTPASYPVVELSFTRKREAIGSHSLIPVGTEVRTHSNDPEYRDLAAYTVDELHFSPGEKTKKIPARLNELGKKESLPEGLLVKIPRVLGPIDRVTNTRLLRFGRDRESIPSLIKRGRDRIRRGDILVSLEDFRQEALALGATQVAVLPQRYGVPNNYANSLRIAVYPPTVVDVVEQSLASEERVVGSQIVEVQSADLIPISGEIQIKFTNDLAQSEKMNLVAKTIANQINPPHAVWGDRDFKGRLATALERTEGIYAVPKMALKHARTGEPIEDLLPKMTPWQLFVIQKSIRII